MAGSERSKSDIYAHDANLLGDNINNTRNDTERLLQTSRDIGLEENIDKTDIWSLSLRVGRGANKSTP